MSKIILREYVRTILSESEYGGFDISAGAEGPYGASFGSGKDLYNVFVKPFTDVVDTAVGKTKELSQRTQTLAKVAFEALATSLIPTLADDFESIFGKEQAELDKLKAQYKDVYDATWSAFKDNDVVMAAFMYSPAAMITAKVAQQAPIQTVKLLNILAGGKLDSFLQKVIKKFQLGDTRKPLDRDEGPGLPEGVRLDELDNDTTQPNVGKVLTQKKIKQIVNSDPKTTQMSNATQASVEKALQQVIQRAQAVSSASSIEDLERKLGIKLKGTEKLASVPQAERATLEKTLLSGARKSAILLYIKSLEKMVQGATSAGVPQDHPYVIVVSKAISKIKALS